MKNQEIKKLSDQQLADSLAAESENLLKLKFAHAISPIEDPMSIRVSRKLIARFNTEQTQRKTAASKQ